MTGGMAKYEVGEGTARRVVRYFLRPRDADGLSPDEAEAREVIREGFLGLSGRVGVTVDPYKAAESILADHYGYARMVEANHDWRPRVRY